MLKKRNLLFLSLLILGALLLSSCFLNPPATEGILKGQIMLPEGTIQAKDLTGQALPDATVNIIDLTTGVIFATTTTNATGHYQVSVPPGGPYLLEAVKDGVKLEQITCQVEVGIEYDLGTADCITTATALIAQAMIDAGDNPASINFADILADPDFDDLSSIVCTTIQAGQDPTTSAVVLQAVENFLNPPTPAPAPTPTYTVSFDSQGGSEVDVQTVEQGDKVTEPTAPTRTDYAFGGWYKESGCSNAWNFTTDIVTENITLYAKWMSIDATLSVLIVSTGTLNPVFSSTTISYTVELPHETSEVPTVNATTTDSNATKLITQATNLTGTEAERTATVVVTAEDGITQKTYTITFSLLGPVHNTTKDIYYNTIQAALNAASTGNTIEVSDGIYEESITFPSGKLIILQSVNGASSTIIQGANSTNTVTSSNSLDGTTLEGFTITHESPNTGKGIDNGGILIINDCMIIGNKNPGTDYGGGIYNHGTLTINGSMISDNSIHWCGGGIYNSSDCNLIISDSTISANSGPHGGGIHNVGILTINTDSVISDNDSTGYNGGGIYNQGVLTIDTGSEVSGNTSDLGGGIYNYGTLTIQGGSYISGNTVTSYGGGIYNETGYTATITGASTVSGNSTPGPGGGICNKGTLDVNGASIVSTNSASTGGGIYNDNGALTITSSTISGNTASFVGNSGGIHLVSGAVTIGGEGKENTICGNTVGGTATMANQIYPDTDPYPNNYISASCTQAIGDNYGGGVVAYIFQIGDPNYIADKHTA